MQVSFVTADGITDHRVSDLEGLLTRTDGFVWVDMPDYDAEAEAVLAGPIRAHPLVRQACAERNFVPTVHAYEHQLFVILHTALTGEGGHVHVLELDMVVGDRYLVTVHGPRNPVVSAEAASEETRRGAREARGRASAAAVDPRARVCHRLRDRPAPERRRAPGRNPAAADGGAGHGGRLPPARGSCSSSSSSSGTSS